jgi:succinate dehydrogenase / fumarate reductase flavoprotein subunit
MSRTAEGLTLARKQVRALRDEFYSDLYLPGVANDLNPELEKALRVADFMDLGEVMIVDALNRNESCGGHFREEYQTQDGEALRRDDAYAYVSAWEFKGWNEEPVLHKELLHFENVELKTRSYQ